MATVAIANTTANISGKTVTLAERDHTITGSWTFDRDPSAPFAVSAGSAVATNLDADKLDGLHGPTGAIVGISDAQTLTNKTLTAPIINGSITGTPSMGADLLFTDASFDIGKSAATRPRDLFLSRNEVVGGTLGVTGVATFTAQSVHTQGVDLSTGGRVQFPAVANPTVNANCLDDYAEGTWTPSLGGSGGQSGQTYSTQVGYYIKIGKMVTAWFNIALTAVGTITTNAQVQGLPFTVENVASFVPVSNVYWGAMTATFVSMATLASANTTVATLYGVKVAAVGMTALVQADFAATSNIAGCITFRASA